MATVLLLATPFATKRVFGDEADDLARQIDVHRADAKDMEQLDKWHTAVADLTLLRLWLDDAWDLRSKHQYNGVRELLDRVDAQANLIRQEIKLGDLAAEVDRRETVVKETQLKLVGARQTLVTTRAQTQVIRIALDGGPPERANPDGGVVTGQAER